MLSCMAFRQQTGIPDWPGEMSLSLDSFNADCAHRTSPQGYSTRVDSFASRRSLTSEISDGEPNTVGTERHAVHIGLRGVRLRRVRGRVPQAV